MLAAVAALGATIAVAYAPLWLAGLLLAGLGAGAAIAVHDRLASRDPRPARVDPERLDLFVDEHRTAVVILSRSGAVRAVSGPVAQVLGWDGAELAGMETEELVHPDDIEQVRTAFGAVRDLPRARATVAVRVRGPAAWRRLEVTYTNAVHLTQVDGIAATIRDVSDRTGVEHQRAASGRQLRSLADLTARALQGADEATLVNASVAGAREALGVDGIELYRTGADGLDLAAGIGPGGIAVDRRSTARPGLALAVRALAARRPVRETGAAHSELATAIAVPIGRGRLSAGALVARVMQPRAFTAADVAYLETVAGLVAVVQRQRGAEQDAFRRSRHDELTGLVNREVFLERVETSIERCGEPDERIGVLLIDLDHFKIVNDSLGHTAGDALLEAVSDRLAEGLRPGDTLARFGGDEFVVLARGLGSADQALLAAQRMQSALRRPFAVAGHDVQVSASVGVAACCEPGAAAETLLQQADAALYRAKELGRERVELFEPAMLDEAVTRLRTEGELREALAGDQLRVFYQPIVDLATGRTEQLEALVRWVHPGRGLVAPSEFIPISEATGLIEEIGAWVIDEVCRQARAWVAQGNPMRVSVNVSARQLADPGFLEVVDAALGRHHVAPSLLAMELTENALMADPATAFETLHALHERGITIAVDDFGTGSSPLSYLRTVPIDVVKIDRTLVTGIDRAGDDYEVIAALIPLARAIGTKVVAEGVETEQQLELLRDLGCDLAQGFLFSPAVFDIDYGTDHQSWSDLVLDSRR